MTPKNPPPRASRIAPRPPAYAAPAEPVGGCVEGGTVGSVGGGGGVVVGSSQPPNCSQVSITGTVVEVVEDEVDGGKVVEVEVEVEDSGGIVVLVVGGIVVVVVSHPMMHVPGGSVVVVSGGRVVVVVSGGSVVVVVDVVDVVVGVVVVVVRGRHWCDRAVPVRRGRGASWWRGGRTWRGRQLGATRAGARGAVRPTRRHRHARQVAEPGSVVEN